MRPCLAATPLSSLALLLAAGCVAGPPSPDTVYVPIDADRDGWERDRDCDDAAPAVFPGAREVCNDGVDNDCDGTDNGCALRGEKVLAAGDASVLLGDVGGAHSGWSVAPLGDLDGDGFDDFVIGAYNDGRGGTFAGAAFVFRGPIVDGLKLDAADAVIVGEEPYDYAGWTVGSAGDLNGDGVGDLFVGAYGDDSAGEGSGAVYVVFGPVEGVVDLADADVKITGSAAYDNAGIAASAGGDLNGDGRDDLVVGAYGVDRGGADAGAAFVFFGPLAGAWTTDDAHRRVDGTTAGQWVGTAVAGLGDTNGDGFDDLGVGAVGVDARGDGAGAAFVFLGPLTADRTIALASAAVFGERAGDRFGSTLGAGDFDGDGRRDVVVGAPLLDVQGVGEDVGGAYVLYGPMPAWSGAEQADATVVGAAVGDRAGIAVASIGDLDGDGRDDLAVGVLYDDRGAADAGAAAVYYGPAVGRRSVRSADVSFLGANAGDRAGFAVGGAGDVDGDGRDDLLVGCHGQDVDGADAGATWLVTGAGY